MTKPYHFPFGSTLKPVEQEDRGPKDLFVLGVYASAVHARWLDASGKSLVNALAVASEPKIFWDGTDARSIIAKIKVPNGAGSLQPAADKFNGPSGSALDKMFLKPLGYSRANTWLCDLLPESRMNPSQAKAIKRAYEPLVERFTLPLATIPAFRKAESNTTERRNAILDELATSKAKTLLVLGDIPIQQFVRPLCDTKVRNLDHLKELAGGYGKLWRTTIDGRSIDIIGLCHPRQAAGLGVGSAKWRAIHEEWMKRV